MNTKYQLITIGAANPLKGDIIKTFEERVKELGLPSHLVSMLDASNFSTDYRNEAPAVCIYFGQNTSPVFDDLDILKALHDDAVFIIPVVEDLTRFTKDMPPALHPINGFALSGPTDVNALVNRLLESLSLLRQSRRLFISYKRDEATPLAIQLYEHFDACGFDVFLDTHSILPGAPFQDHLWHRMADTDVVILINSKNFFASKWTTQELAKASAMSIGVVQLILPGVDPKEYASLAFPIYLDDTDFDGAGTSEGAPQRPFTPPTVKNIAEKVEAVRARSLAARQDNIIEEFTTAAKKQGRVAYLQPERILTIENGKQEKIDVIPAVGMPQSLTFNQIEELIKRIRQTDLPKPFLLYDHRSILKEWLEHLGWLDLHLPIKTIKVTEIDQWIAKL